MDRRAALADQCRTLVALSRSLEAAEQERERRLAVKLAELDAWVQESVRIQKLITGGAARREARLRALEDAIYELTAQGASNGAPRPLDIPARPRVDASVVRMRSVDPNDPPAPR